MAEKGKSQACSRADRRVVSIEARRVMRKSSMLIVSSVALLVACSDAANSGSDEGRSNSDGPATSGSSPSEDESSAAGKDASRPSSGTARDAATGARDSGATAGPSGGSPTGGGRADAGASPDDVAASGDGGGANTGASDAGSSAGCTRELLKATVDSYFKALAAHDPSMLPLADNVKFTEDGKASKVGEAGLWKTAGALKHVHSALDTESCQTASQAVVPDGSTDIPVAVRLKLQDQKLTEIETIAVQAGDYEALGSPFPSNTGALTMSAMRAKWEEPVVAAQRNSRAEILGWIEKYFRMFPRGICNTSSDCKRIENGGGNFGCAFGASCAAGMPSASDNVMKPRALLADVETGVGVGFTMFMGHTDMHMYKMYGGQIYEVSAILAAAPSSGWD
jgi:hypothetical protein